VLSQVPAVAKLVIALDQLDSVAPSEGQLVGGAGGEIVYGISTERKRTATYG
jgi:hypothetical protein